MCVFGVFGYVGPVQKHGYYVASLNISCGDVDMCEGLRELYLRFNFTEKSLSDGVSRFVRQDGTRVLRITAVSFFSDPPVPIAFDLDENNLGWILTNPPPSRTKELDDQIAKAAMQLATLYQKRRGLMVDDTTGWCALCGKYRVAVAQGAGTCENCSSGA